MSNTILRQVEATTQARGHTFALIKALAYCHHDQFGYAFPKLAYLANKVRISVRTVQRHVAKLEQMGELIVERVHGRGWNNRYYLKLVGFTPDAAQKHVRYRRAVKAILRAKREAAEGADHPAAENLTSPPILRQTLVNQTGADAPARCVGYPRKGSPETKRYCDAHHITHWPI